MALVVYFPLGGTEEDHPRMAQSLEATKTELLAEVLQRCMGMAADDNTRQDFGDMNGGALQRPSEVAAELMRALADEGLTIAAISSGMRAERGSER